MRFFLKYDAALPKGTMLESEAKVKVLALDLEGTLISNAVSQIARPGLFDFLEDCRKLFPRIVIFTSVNEERFRSIANLLTTEGYAPNWFADIEYITCGGETKNLIFVDGASPEEILLVDDYEKYVHPGQENQWIKVPYFDYPYSDDDLGLREVLRLLRIRVAS
jgi:NLI interacting factor-like phosphatase